MQLGLNIVMDSLAKRVKNRRIELGLTQADVAKIAGLKQSDISKIEHSRIYETTKMLGLARALRCNPDWLASAKGDMLPTQPEFPLTAQEKVASAISDEFDLEQALDLIEIALMNLDVAGRDRLAPLFESFARSPDEVIKAAIQILLKGQTHTHQKIRA